MIFPEINHLISFDSQTLGSLVDWLTFGVTIAGTWFVARTFQEQVKINAQQSELNRLSMEKDRREIRPRFVIKLKGEAVIDRIGVHLILENAIAEQLSIEYEENGIWKVDGNLYFQDEFQVGETFSLTTSKNDRHKNNNGNLNIGEIKFKDEAGRPYIQYLYRSIEEGYGISFPRLTSDLTQTI